MLTFPLTPHFALDCFLKITKERTNEENWLQESNFPYEIYLNLSLPSKLNMYVCEELRIFLRKHLVNLTTS